MAKKILVIEDSPTIVMMTKVRLEDSGYDVICAVDGETGLQKMHEENPDLVLLDVRLPGIDGFEVCRIAKSDPKLKNIPIIFLTTSAQKWDFEKNIEVGGDDYMTKPYEGKVLIEKIRKFLKE